MNQEQYNTIIECINFGMPAKANELIKALNVTVSLANERLNELNTAEQAKEEKEN